MIILPAVNGNRVIVTGDLQISCHLREYDVACYDCSCISLALIILKREGGGYVLGLLDNESVKLRSFCRSYEFNRIVGSV